MLKSDHGESKDRPKLKGILNMATLRLDLQIDSAIIEAAKLAASRKGMDDLCEYILDLIKSDVIDTTPHRESITLENEDFDRFVSNCLNAAPPNRKLKETHKRMIEQGIE